MSFIHHPDHQDRIAKSMLAALFTLAISGFFLAVAIFCQTAMRSREALQVEQTQMSILSSAQQLRAAGKFSDCFTEANKILDGSLYTEAQSVKRDCQKGFAKEQLTIVRQLQSQGNQEAAIERVAPLSSVSAEAKKTMEEIASRLLETGQLHYQERSLAYLNNAIYPISVIPSVSDHYNTAQVLIKQWHEEYANNREHIQVAQVALKQEDASQVQQVLEQVSVHPFWQDQAKAIRQEVGFLVTYQTAEAFMERHEWENAIAEASKLPNVQPWMERKFNLISRAEATLQRQELCKTVTLGLWQKCYL